MCSMQLFYQQNNNCDNYYIFKCQIKIFWISKKYNRNKSCSFVWFEKRIKCKITNITKRLPYFNPSLNMHHIYEVNRCMFVVEVLFQKNWRILNEETLRHNFNNYSNKLFWNNKYFLDITCFESMHYCTFFG